MDESDDGNADDNEDDDEDPSSVRWESELAFCGRDGLNSAGTCFEDGGRFRLSKDTTYEDDGVVSLKLQNT